MKVDTFCARFEVKIDRELPCLEDRMHCDCRNCFETLFGKLPKRAREGYLQRHTECCTKVRMRFMTTKPNSSSGRSILRGQIP